MSASRLPKFQCHSFGEQEKCYYDLRSLTRNSHLLVVEEVICTCVQLLRTPFVKTDNSALGQCRKIACLESQKLLSKTEVTNVPCNTPKIHQSQKKNENNLRIPSKRFQQKDKNKIAAKHQHTHNKPEGEQQESK